ncbi:hypothetical protein AGMMS50268_32140 [Spirochaetia bacterium]|nr:hypothetical protein AGMMS50268_32140 [Spirochaetia bacterium]
MKAVLGRLAIFLPVLYVLCHFAWGLIPLDSLPPVLKLLLDDFIGPLVIMGVIIMISITCLWRSPLFSNWMHFLFGTNFFIQGTWKGILHYHFDDKDQTKPAYLVIRQDDGFSMNIWLITDERISTSKFSGINPYNGVQRIIYEYGVEDSPQNKKKNPLHTGFCCLNFNHKEKFKRLSGMYFTSRHTVGEMEFTHRNKKAVMNYQEANKLFGV